MKRTVLSIEDQADIRRLIRMTLEFKGLDVLEASDGEEGIRLARQHVPDLILLDVMMPGMDGLTASRILGDDPLVAHIPIIILSALGRTSDIDAGLETGVRAYLVKPFSPWELLALVDQLTLTQPAATPAQA
jgi:two-component system phosphate regulon response regulator PhoB